MLPKHAKLLIVDDDDSTRISLSIIFSQLGYLVRSGTDGFSGLSEIRKEIPDVLLSDLNMVRMPGLEFLTVVRHWLPSIRVIAMTKVFSDSVAPPRIAADALFQKGASAARLIKAVDTMTQPKRSDSRLSIENSLGFQIIEAIPSHPDIEQLAFPVRRTLAFSIPQKEQPSGIFLVPAASRTQAVRL